MIAFVTLTEQGGALARRLQNDFPDCTSYGKQGRVVDCDQPFEDMGQLLSKLFREGTPIVGICAAGILIRLLAPNLKSKHDESPVIAIAENGDSVVPLLGGHHGANDLARSIANVLDGHATITTTGDLRLGFALDVPPEGWVIENPEMLKPVTAALLAGDAVQLVNKISELTWPPAGQFAGDDDATYRVLVSDRVEPSDPTALRFIPPTLTLGVGAERGVPTEDGVEALETALREAGLDPRAVAAVGSLDIKVDEPAVKAAADRLEVPFRVFDAEALEEMTPRLQNPSDIVFQETGCHGVAEGAALALGGAGSDLILPKRRFARVTVAVAQSTEPAVLARPDETGRTPGHLFVVGIGPGTSEWRTAQAVEALQRAEVAIGYDLYLDLAADLITRADQIRSPLGEEAQRAELALREAAKGKTVALICSGDPGIYALATLVFEVLDRSAGREGERALNGVEVTVVPGISAFQAASARLGAPMGHDFCLISLSDLLTPREVIRQRLKAAAEGDFVIAFYNPQSLRRRTLLGEAIETLRQDRPGDTPVAVARNLGRPDERITLTPISDFDPESVDMLSLVVVGNSETRVIEQGGEQRLYTPRGYAKKMDQTELLPEEATGGNR